MPIRAILPSSVPDRGPAVFAGSISSLALATVFCISRILTRVVIVKRVTLDDYSICLALVLSIGLTTAVAVDVSLGLGRQYPDIADKDQTSLNVAAYAFTVIYVCFQLSVWSCAQHC